MNQNITPETKRRMALCLSSAPPHRNRRRSFLKRIIASLKRDFNTVI